jgi:ribonuclease D
MRRYMVAFTKGERILKLEALVQTRKPDLYDGDLPDDRLAHYLKKDVVAVDTETRGLNIPRDRLCLVQICDDEGIVSLVRYQKRPADNVKKLMEDPSTIKLFHFGRFDVAVLKYYLDAKVNPIWCTKLASKLVRTYTDRHSLKDLGRELLGLEMDKSDQTSDWARSDLTASQMEYAANDVRVLIPIYKQIKAILEREGRLGLAERLFEFLPVVAELDLGGWRDIYEH